MPAAAHGTEFRTAVTVFSANEYIFEMFSAAVPAEANFPLITGRFLPAASICLFSDSILLSLVSMEAVIEYKRFSNEASVLPMFCNATA